MSVTSQSRHSTLKRYVVFAWEGLEKMNIEHRTSNSPEASKHLSAWADRILNGKR